MISFDFQVACDYPLGLKHKQWLKAVVRKEGKVPGDILYLFCDDAYLLKQNQHFLNHDTFTDIITFDQCVGEVVAGNIMISLDRVEENSEKFNVSYEDELLRVVAHGVLHLCGYKDKTDDEAQLMRQKENESIAMFHKESFCK